MRPIPDGTSPAQPHQGCRYRPGWARPYLPVSPGLHGDVSPQQPHRPGCKSRAPEMTAEGRAPSPSNAAERAPPTRRERSPGPTGRPDGQTCAERARRRRPASSLPLAAPGRGRKQQTAGFK